MMKISSQPKISSANVASRSEKPVRNGLMAIRGGVMVLAGALSWICGLLVVVLSILGAGTEVGLTGLLLLVIGGGFVHFGSKDLTASGYLDTTSRSNVLKAIAGIIILCSGLYVTGGGFMLVLLGSAEVETSIGFVFGVREVAIGVLIVIAGTVLIYLGSRMIVASKCIYGLGIRQTE